MRSNTFSRWLLDDGYAETSRSDYVAQARRLDRYYGDLDRLYDQDRFSALIEELAYTKNDEHSARPNPAKFQIVGDFYNNLATYRSTLRCYARFRASEAQRSVSPLSGPHPWRRWWQKLRRLSARC